MTSPFLKSTIRIPVRLVDGRWEFFYGGGVPVRTGATGDLVIEKGRADILDVARVARAVTGKINTRKRNVLRRADRDAERRRVEAGCCIGIGDIKVSVTDI